MTDPVTSRNVVDFRSYQQARQAANGKAQPISARNCRHCGASLMDGESDDDCSSLGISDVAPAPRRIFAD
jgi:hypothetical protein